MFNEFYVVKHCDGIRNFLTRNFLNQFRLGLFREAGHFGQVEKSVLANLSAESLGLGFDLSVQGFISSQLGFFVRSLPDKALYDLIGSKCVYDLSEFSFGIDQLPVYYRKFTNGGECGCQIIYVAYIVFFFVEFFIFIKCNIGLPVTDNVLCNFIFQTPFAGLLPWNIP